MNEYKALTEFYPTPPEIMAKMVKGCINKKDIKYILEPSAGKGDIISFILYANEYVKSSYANYNNFKEEVLNDLIEEYKQGRRNKHGYTELNFTCVEIDSMLCSILNDLDTPNGTKVSVYNEDFLGFEDEKHYDLIIMNPPFSNGDEHLLKAISIAEKTGSKIVCLLNAETIRNPYSNKRKELAKQLDKYNATFEYIKDGFKSAERKTDVEVVIVRLDVPSPYDHKSKIWEELDDLKIEIDESQEYTDIVSADNDLKMAVCLYKKELEAGKKLINEYLALKPYLSSRFNEEETPEYMRGCTLTLVNDLKKQTLDWNDYVYSVRYKYWYQLLHNPLFIGNLTSNLQQEYMDSIREFANKDFSLRNIYTVKIDMLKRMSKGVEKKIVDLFEKLSYEHSLGCEKNVHYFNGWASNSAFKINKKVVVPYLSCWDYIWKEFKYYELAKFLDDVEKCLDFLNTKDIEWQSVGKLLDIYQGRQQTKGLNFKHFEVDVFKKGTVHIKFKDEDLLKKFNLYGCMRKGWLPHSYGKKSYTEMSTEERTVIDEYEGKDSYEIVYNNPAQYIIEPERQLLLTAN